MKKVICNAITADVPTLNGNIYSREVLEKIAELSNNQSKQHRCFVADGVFSDRLLLKDVVGLVHETSVEDDKLVCQIELLETPRALELGKLLSMGFSVTPRLHGTKDGDRINVLAISLDGWELDK